MGSTRNQSFPTHYDRNYAENRGWSTGDISSVYNGPSDALQAGYHLQNIATGTEYRTILAHYADTDVAKQALRDWLVVGRRCGPGNTELGRFTIEYVDSDTIRSISGPGGTRYGYNIRTRARSGDVYPAPSNTFNNNPWQIDTGLLFFDDTDFDPGTFLYVGSTQGQNARTTDADWRRVSSETDHFSIDPGNANVTFTDSLGSQATLRHFTRGTAGVVQAPGGVTTTRFLREDGLWQAPEGTVDTTYAFQSGTNGSFTVTPSGGSAQVVMTGGSGGTDTEFTADTDGLVPHPGSTAAQDDYFLSGAGNWIHHDLDYVETIIGNPDTLVTASDYTTVSAAPASAGQLRLLNSSDADTT